MSVPIPAGNPFLEGNFAPWGLEGEARDLPVVGAIPRELNGAYYRNGPNPQFAPRGRYHWFDGDGMIHAFFFEDGRCHYRNRWVRTERFLREREAGESLFGGLSDMAASDPSVQGLSANAANTNVVWHGGRLLALWEAGPPTELDPNSLETRGLWDFDGKLVRHMDPELAGNPDGVVPGIMTAHPKMDPDTGEMHFFAYSPVPPNLVYLVADREGRLVRSEEIDVPYSSMMHDFIVTDEHVIFPIFPAAFDFDLIESTGMPLGWQPERGTRIGVMPRKGGNRDVVWFQSDPCYVFHPMNAHTEGERVIAEVARYPVLPLFDVEGAKSANLYRWTLDLASGTVKEEALDDCPTEFPRLDERFAGKAYRHGYAGGGLRSMSSIGDPEAEASFDAVLHFDLATGTRRAHQVPIGDAVGEPVFVPRSADSAEGDGFLLVLCYRGGEGRSDLLVLDAADVESEPIATLQLPHRVPYGFHGNWRPGTP